MNIVVFGATGMVGSRVVAELEQRGHTVTGATRATGADVTDPRSVAAVAAGADAVVSAISARGGDYTLADVAAALVAGLPEAGVRRLVVVGGAGSLEVAPGKRLVDTPGFHEEWKPEALAQSAALDYYRGIEDLDWTYVSPAALIQPGRRTGSYRTSGDALLVDEEGHSQISAEDYAVAIADLLEQDTAHRERVSVAW
jgi:putative NADH-flavin reductase